jgi:excisionase family DNA binding protein
MDTVYYTPKEVAERLKLRVQTIYDYIRKGRLPAVRLGNRCRIAASDLEAFLERQKGLTPAVTVSRPSPIVIDAREQAERNEAAMRLLAEWMADESGYDERVWPIVEKLLAENPVSFGEPGHE